jgi:hypothetical protein
LKHTDIKAMQRLTELLADEAVDGLARPEREEVEALSSQIEELGRDEFMKIAGLMQIGMLDQDRSGQQRMPDALRERLLRQGQALVTSRHASNDSTSGGNVTALRPPAKRITPARPRSPMAAAGWLLAAMFAFAFVVVRNDVSIGVETTQTLSSLAEARAGLLEETDTIISPWNPPTETGYQDVSGDVVWNSRIQQGYMRLAGMPANNAQRMQYQLWIVDPDRDSKPVDGGVFNIPAGQTEVLIPISAKLAVIDPKAFAITAEQPGGVVVSAGPLLVVAPAKT